MVKHLTAHGNSAALVIDKPILELLNIDMKTPLELTTDGRNLVVSPVDTSGRARKFKKALARVIVKHGKTFARLAR